MRATRDSFLHFLADNLPASMPVNNIRRDTQDTKSDRLKIDSVNVQFLDSMPTLEKSETLVEISVLHTDELTGLDWVRTLFQLLSTGYQTPKLDYTDPANPVPFGTMIYWNTQIAFRTVYSDSYCDYRVLFSLYHAVN